MAKKPKITKPGAVKQIFKPRFHDEPEKAEIEVKDADPLYKEVRIENKLEDENGKKVKLKEGAHVSVTFEADPDETVPQDNSK